MLELDAAVAGERVAEDRVMSLEGTDHLGTRRPGARRPFDISEEKDDGLHERNLRLSGRPRASAPVRLSRVLHLRLIVPVDLVDQIVQELQATEGVAHLIRVPTTTSTPDGVLVLCDVVREAGNGVIEWLQEMNVHHRGAITVETLDTVVSDAAAAAEARAPGHAADALVWEEIEDRARDDATLTASYLVFMSIAAVIAGIGILLDSPVLIVGAMVVGPEYAPLSALCVAVVRTRARAAAEAASTLGVGLAVAAAVAFVATALLRATNAAPDSYDLGERELTAFISHPDSLAVVVAVLAGVVGMLALTEGRSGTLIGVLVSVTTIPAVANMGVAAAYGEWSEVGGAAAQLAINVVGLVTAGVVTLAVQSRFTGRVRTRRELPTYGRVVR